MTQPATTLRELLGLSLAPSALSASALILIDCQNTYREGVMQLEGVEAALVECRKLLDRARAAQIPIIHVQHDAGADSPYDTNATIGTISDIVAPHEGEPIITKHYPNSFIGTELDRLLKERGIKKLILVGFMTHMCINSTAHGGFNLGYECTVVASATATRGLVAANGNAISAQMVQDGAIASTRDLYAAIANTVEDIPN